MKFKKPGTIKAIKPDKNRWWYEKRPPGVTGATITFDKFIEDLDTKLVLGACLFGIVFKQAQKSELRRLYIMSFYETFSMTEIVEEWGFRPSVVKRMIAVGLIEKKKTGYKNFHYLYLSAKALIFKTKLRPAHPLLQKNFFVFLLSKAYL